jgi:opacity protein-like surface antigen
MMQKKLLLAAVALLISPAILFAAPVPSAAAVEATAHEGVSANQPSDTFADEVPQNTAPTPQTTTAVVNTPKRAKASFYAGLGLTMLNGKGATELMPKLYVGYGTFIGKSKKIYGALEIAGGAGNISLAPNHQYRVANLISASFIPGYMINEWTMLYARFGAQSTRYSTLDSSNNGGLYGVGLAIYTSPHWDTRIEYDYANNKNLNQFNIDYIYKFK